MSKKSPRPSDDQPATVGQPDQRSNPISVDPAALRAFLTTQRERVFGALGIVQLVAEEVVDDADHGDRCYGALGAARAQLQATHDELYDWVAAHLGEQPR